MLESANKTHLNRLFKLRFFAIFGQIIAVLFTQYFLKIDLPLFPVGNIVFLIILFNAYVWVRLAKNNSITENEVFIHLSFDVIVLGLLLYFTGGATNPFVLLFLFPITITVTILPIRYAWLLATLSVICYSLLMFYYQPLPIGHAMHGSENATEYDLHLMGMWMAFILNAGLITYYVYGMGSTLRRQQDQLTIAREQSIRDEQLVILGTLAASTAHELGTPLATMSLLVDELEQEVSKESEYIKTDLAGLKSQIIRCKSSLTDLAASVGASSDHFSGKQQPVCEYVTNMVTELQQVHKDANINLHCNINVDSTFYTDRTLSLSLINIIENSIEVSPGFVEITVELLDECIQIIVIDNGPGFSEQALNKIGQQPYSNKELGLGLGLYLAYAAIRRRQGKIEQTNIQTENMQSGGSKTAILLPLASN